MTKYQNGQMKEADWIDLDAVNQTNLYQGNSVLRGQTPGKPLAQDFMLIE